MENPTINTENVPKNFKIYTIFQEKFDVSSKEVSKDNMRLIAIHIMHCPTLKFTHSTATASVTKNTGARRESHSTDTPDITGACDT
jgi:hypothetical protein